MQGRSRVMGYSQDEKSEQPPRPSAFSCHKPRRKFADSKYAEEGEPQHCEVIVDLARGSDGDDSHRSHNRETAQLEMHYKWRQVRRDSVASECHGGKCCQSGRWEGLIIK